MVTWQRERQEYHKRPELRCRIARSGEACSSWYKVWVLILTSNNAISRARATPLGAASPVCRLSVRDEQEVLAILIVGHVGVFLTVRI